MEEEKLKVKKLNYNELLKLENIVGEYLKKIDSDCKDAKNKGGI